MSLDFEYRLAARDDRLAEQHASPRCHSCGNNDTHESWCRELREMERDQVWAPGTEPRTERSDAA